jgi:hypothetical protein
MRSFRRDLRRCAEGEKKKGPADFSREPGVSSMVRVRCEKVEEHGAGTRKKGAAAMAAIPDALLTRGLARKERVHPWHILTVGQSRFDNPVLQPPHPSQTNPSQKFSDSTQQS